MRPVSVSIDVPQRREDVYEYLDVLANHAEFTGAMMRDWQLGGPPRGVGGTAHVTAVIGGRSEPVDVEVIAAEAPVRTAERNVSAGGKRVATGTYTLSEAPGGGTHISFEYAWQKAPLSERLAAPLVRRVMRSSLEESMQQLAVAPAAR